MNVTSAANGTLTLSNKGAQAMPFVWVYRKEKSDTPSESWTCALAPGETQIAAGWRRHDVPFAQALVMAGLNAEEAKALTETWRESYFEKPGLRVFWIVPREFTDSLLPIEINPRPAHLERVLVGRTEILIPAFEATLVLDFANHHSDRWKESRYFNSYVERVEQLSRQSYHGH